MKVPLMIKRDIKSTLGVLEIELKEWLLSHLSSIEKITLYSSANQEEKMNESFWLVTNHTGNNDSNYRIVYGEQSRLYGLETTSFEDIQIFLGFYGNLTDAVESL